MTIHPSVQSTLRAERHRMRVRAALTTNLIERELLQASASRLARQIETGLVVAAGERGEFTGAVLVLCGPDAETTTYADGGEAPQHCTICYLGPADALGSRQRAAAETVAQRIAGRIHPFTPIPLSPARFGDDPVLLIEHPAIQQARDIALADPVLAGVEQAANEHPHFIPHVSGADTAPTFDRVGLWLGEEDRQEYPMAVTAAVWTADLHPRGRDGKFIETGALLSLFGFGYDDEGRRTDLSGRRGVVQRIEGPDRIWVRDPDGGPEFRVRSSQVEQAPTAKARFKAPPVYGRDKKTITPGAKVGLVDMPGFRHGQRGDPEVAGEVVEVKPNAANLGKSVVVVKVTDPRWDPTQFGATFNARPDQVAAPGVDAPPAPKAPKATAPSTPSMPKGDTGTPSPRQPLINLTEAPTSPHLAPLQTPPNWDEMTPESRRTWITDQMEADYAAWRGQPTQFDFHEYDSGIALSLANTYRDLTNWDPETTARIDAFIPQSKDPEGSLGSNAIAVARPGTAHPGGIGPKVKQTAIVFKPKFFRDMTYYEQGKKINAGPLPHSESGRHGDPTLTLVHEFSHQRQFRFLDISMRDVGKAWSPTVRDDGFGLVPDSSNWPETQALRYDIQKLAPTSYGQSKSSEAFAESWTARLVGDSSPELDSTLDRWDAYMAVAAALPQDRYETTMSFDALSPDERSVFWEANGPMLELPGMRDHYPEAAAEYDAWRTGQSVEAQQAQPSLLPADWGEGEAAMAPEPPPVTQRLLDGTAVEEGATVRWKGNYYVVSRPPEGENDLVWFKDADGNERNVGPNEQGLLGPREAQQPTAIRRKNGKKTYVKVVEDDGSSIVRIEPGPGQPEVTVDRNTLTMLPLSPSEQWQADRLEQIAPLPGVLP